MRATAKEAESWSSPTGRKETRSVPTSRTMTPFEKCPVCCGEIIERQVQKLLRGGRHTASITVPAEVCLHCGKRLYSRDVVKRFEEIRTKLARQETEEFQPIGQAFEVR